jgi:hypothetical protein
MNEYQGVSYSSVSMKNTFHEEDIDTIRELTINDYNFMTSLELKLIGEQDEIEEILSDPWTEVFTIDEDHYRHPYLKMDKMNKYVKFYINFYQ